MHGGKQRRDLQLRRCFVRNGQQLERLVVSIEIGMRAGTINKRRENGRGAKIMQTEMKARTPFAAPSFTLFYGCKNHDIVHAVCHIKQHGALAHQ